MKEVRLSGRKGGKDAAMKAAIQKGLDEGKPVWLASETRVQAEEWFKTAIPWWRRWWIRLWVTPWFRWRVRYLRVGDECMAMVGMKSGWGKVVSILEEGGRRWGYTITFPPQPYPQSMVVANGTYCVPLAHVVELDRWENDDDEASSHKYDED